jgi:hypothetical protein
MHIRVVRFTDVDPQKLEGMLTSMKESDGPPEGVPSTGLQVVVDEDQRTVVVIQHFANAEDMRKGAEVLGAMDSAQTPGTRASVDAGEMKVDLKA